MTIEMTSKGGAASRIPGLILWLCRLAALALFGLGLAYWVRLVGVVEGPLWRFDLMPVPWRIAALMLAVLYPIAGVGLWMGVSWGIVLWAAAALVEGFMLFGLPAVFGGRPGVFAAHAFALALLASLQILRRVGRNRAGTV